MIRKKTVAILLGAMLLGGGAAGTKALFMDSENIAAELSISTGDLDFEIDNSVENKWTLNRKGMSKDLTELKEGTTNDIIDEYGYKPKKSDGYSNVEHIGKEVLKEGEKLENNFVNNLKPGDTLTKTIRVKNVGTLVGTNLSLSENNDKNINGRKKTENPHDLFSISGKMKKGNEDITEQSKILPGEIVDIELSIKFKDGVGGKHNSENGFNSDDQENTILDLNEAWKFTATQQTK